MSDPLLKLDVVEESTVPIEIGGSTYRMFKSPRKTVARRLRKFTQLQNRAVELDEKDELTDAEEAEYIDCLVRACRMICDVPVEVLQKLNDAQLQAIMAGFSMLQAGSRQPNGANDPTANGSTTGRPTGMPLSTVLPGSTRARRPRTGSTTSRSKKSKPH